MDGVLLLKTVEFSRCQGLSWNSTYVRPAGGPNRGMLYAAAALQWRIERLSACLGRRRGARADDRYSASRRAPVRATLSPFISPSALWSALSRRSYCPTTPTATFRRSTPRQASLGQ